MDERRTAARQRTLKAGKIEFGPAAIDCVVGNFSSKGAALDVESPVGIPERFNLVVSHDQSRWSARVIRRKEKRIGVRFENLFSRGRNV